jgi:predicted metal-dependent hydrolase
VDSDQLNLLPAYRVVRSTRRKKGIAAVRKHGVIEIHIPARTSQKQERILVPEMIAWFLRRELKQARTDEQLLSIARDLLAKYLPEYAQYESASFTVNWRSMQDRWGSCTSVDRTIRISKRLQSAPDYVLAAVIFHELVHLEIPDHQEQFQQHLARFPENARAEAYLQGFEAGQAAPTENLLLTEE